MSEATKHGLKKTDFFRVAVSGRTVDGREITPEQIDEMAESYSPETYGARINLEHFRSILPDSDFAVLGDVLELKAEDVTINGTKRRGLYAKLAVTDALIAINKKAQKIYTSIEMHPNFEGSGKAYLIGLAVTDSPASLGTEALQFSRKNEEESCITEGLETRLLFEKERFSIKEQVQSALKEFFSVNKADSPDSAFSVDAQKEANRNMGEAFKRVFEAFENTNETVAEQRERIEMLTEQFRKSEEKIENLQKLATMPEESAEEPRVNGADVGEYKKAEY